MRDRHPTLPLHWPRLLNLYNLNLVAEDLAIGEIMGWKIKGFGEGGEGFVDLDGRRNKPAFKKKQTLSTMSLFSLLPFFSSA